MRITAFICAAIFTVAACAAPQAPVESGNIPAEPRAENDEKPLLNITPLEQIIEDGDYNNDRLPETPVPGTGRVVRDIPADPFLERLEQRESDATEKSPPPNAEGSE